MAETCERCLEEFDKLETFSYRVVCEEGTINMDARYCSDCCNEIEGIHQEEKAEQEAGHTRLLPLTPFVLHGLSSRKSGAIIRAHMGHHVDPFRAAGAVFAKQRSKKKGTQGFSR